MQSRRFKLKDSGSVCACPKCGNSEIFTAHSDYCAEDCCEVWVVCECGYDPTAESCGSRFEDVWGGVGDGNILTAIDCWNDAIAETDKPKEQEGSGDE